MEALFKEYHDKMSSRISMKKEVKVMKTLSSSDLLSPDMASGQSEADGEYDNFFLPLTFISSLANSICIVYILCLIGVLHT